MASTLSYQFGDFELDLALFELRRGGARVKIDPRAFSLLHYLLEHRDRVVLKHELLSEVWSGTAVHPSVLPTNIRRIRSALGQPARDPQPIQTLHGRGYRFNLPAKQILRPCSARGLADPMRVEQAFS
jgi:DNA-binding winged helix-turn-helix (wHTH) protein